MLLLASELLGSKKTTQLSRSHVGQNMTNMKGNTKRRLFITDKTIMNIWEIPPLNPGQHIIIILLLLFFFVRFNQFLHFPQRQDKLSSVYEYEFISVSALLLSFFCLFFNHKPWRLLPLGILWKQIDHIIFWSKVRKDQLKKRSRWSHDATWLFLHSPWTSANMDDRKPWQKLQPTLYPPVLPEALPHRSPIRADRLHGSLTSDMCTLQGTVGDCDFSLVKRRTQPGREKRGRNWHFIS